MTDLDRRIEALEVLMLMTKAPHHAVDLEQCSLFVYSAPLARSMTDAAKFLREIPDTLSVILELKAERDALKWKPVETAPKDGTHIWVYDGLGQQGMSFWTGEHWSHGDQDHFSRIDVSHWMPLPEPPK